MRDSKIIPMIAVTKAVTTQSKNRAMKKMLHISDNHGFLPKLYDKFDFIVHSGDFLPNSSRTKKPESKFQAEWIFQNADKLYDWIGDKTILICPGNHDFINPAGPLREICINAISLNETCVTYAGMTFYGFPYVPWLDGSWNYELRAAEMADKVEQLGYIIEANKVDVLVAHGLIGGVLDETGPLNGNEHIGSSTLATAIAYRWERLPTWYLCGHCHDGTGVALVTGKNGDHMVVVNSAITQQIIEVVA